MSLRSIGANYQTPRPPAGVVQALSHQFEDLDQQNDTYIVGMWTFLVTEVMFFGALFLAYSVYRFLYPNVYLDAHHFLDIKWGFINTLVLLTSSLTMALAVHAAQNGRPGRLRGFLAITVLLSFAFLGIKSIEYGNKFREKLFPGPHFDYMYALEEHAKEEGKPMEPTNVAKLDRQEYYGAPSISSATNSSMERGSGVAGSMTYEAAPGTQTGDEMRGNRAQLFFSLYFAMTGLHAIHIIVGIIMMVALIGMSTVKFSAMDDYMPTELVGLYWHFVDIVWIFLFPLMYLIS